MDRNLDNNTTYSNFVKSGTGAKAGLVPAPSTTAGTTKYLREDGAWKTPPDTKTSVVNNNTSTEPGSALDARQANPNIEGTMAASIAQLNSNLENYITARQGYFGTSGVSSSWIQASDCPQKYQYAYKFPDVDGYKFLIGFTNIRWTNSDKYYDYMLRNYILNTQSDKVEMYSGQGTPDCVMYFLDYTLNHDSLKCKILGESTSTNNSWCFSILGANIRETSIYSLYRRFNALVWIVY